MGYMILGADADPYLKAGVFANLEVRPWLRVLP